jgi:hypothetical protein
MTVAASTVVVAARCVSPVPCQPPPTSTVPPPAVPEASSVAPASAIAWPVTSIAPPVGRASGTGATSGRLATVAVPVASRRPDTLTEPPCPPPSTMAPLVPPTLRASTTPDMLMALRAASRARRGTHHDRAAVCTQRPGVLDERALAFGARGRRQRDLQEAVAGQVERRLLAGAEADAAERHGDEPVILHRAADQRGIAAAADRHHAGIRHPCRRSIAFESQVAVEEVVVGDVERGGDEAAADRDRARCGDGDAVRIDQEHLPVSGHRPCDARGRVTGDAVEDRGGRTGLDEFDAVALSDREAVPVDDRLAGRLRDRHAGARLADRHATGGHAGAGGQRLCMQAGDDQCRAGGQHQTEAGEPTRGTDGVTEWLHRSALAVVALRTDSP